MASDLSQLIQDGLCSTLTGLLSKDAKVKELTKVHKKDLEDLQLLKINSTFEFADITSTWSFIIPAYSASYIFNTMIGETSEPILEIDNDISDAISEFISNVSGGLTTAINGSELSDLGNVKFTTVADGIIKGNEVEDTTDMYKVSIDLESIDIIIFITFDNVILPFIETITNSEETFYEEAPEIIEEIEEEIENLETEENKEKIQPIEIQEDIKKDITNQKDDDTDEKSEDENSDKGEEEDPTTDKNNKIKKIILALAILIVLTIGAGVVMYFLGMFDPEPVVVEDKNVTKVIKTKDNVNIIKYPKKNKVKFNPSKINTKRLNARLEVLTKYEVLNIEELETHKLEEKERLSNLKKEEELLKFSQQNKEEVLFTRIEDEEKRDIDKKTKFSDTKLPMDKETIIENKNNIQVVKKDDININKNSKLKFVLVHSLQYKLFKDMISKTDTKNARISICKDENGRTTVYLGPFDNEKSQKQMLNLIHQKANNSIVSLSNINKVEFNKRCNF